LISNT